jgi:hypothetical protein
MNETHVATMSNTAEKKGGSKQESNDVNGWFYFSMLLTITHWRIWR